MNEQTTIAEDFQRGILGLLLAILLLFGLGLASELWVGEYISGIAGVLLVAGAAAAILGLFYEGYTGNP